MSAPNPVVVELIGLGVAGQALHWRVARQHLGTAYPDDVARDLCRAAVQPGTAVLHSTSWRHTAGELVLTYAAFPDARASECGEPLRHHLVTGPGPQEPSPSVVLDEHVAAHAVRHLAYLAAGRDPHVVACAALRADDWEVLVRHGQAVHVHEEAAGRLRSAG